MGGVRPVPCEDFLVDGSGAGVLVPVFWWMELNLVSLEGSAVSSSVFWGIYGFGMALRCLPVNVQGCAPVLWRIGVGCPALAVLVVKIRLPAQET